MGYRMKRTKTRYYIVASIAVVLAAVVFLLAPPRVAAMQPLPLTATGKIDKKALRDRYRDHLANG